MFSVITLFWGGSWGSKPISKSSKAILLESSLSFPVVIGLIGKSHLVNQSVSQGEERKHLALACFVSSSVPIPPPTPVLKSDLIQTPSC